MTSLTADAIEATFRMWQSEVRRADREARQDERAAIVKWLRDRYQNSIADEIDMCEHLGAKNDEE